MTTPATSQQEVYRFLEDRFTCALTCADCARACALRASLLDPDGTEEQERARRHGIMCADVCDATCQLLSEQNCQDENGMRLQLEWCRTVCLECAAAFDGRLDAERGAAACRACARACTDFISVLR